MRYKSFLLLVAKRKKRSIVVETIKFKLSAELQELTLQFATDQTNISLVAIRGIISDIIVKETYTQVNANLQEISVIDLDPTSRYSLVRFYLHFFLIL